LTSNETPLPHFANVHYPEHTHKKFASPPTAEQQENTTAHLPHYVTVTAQFDADGNELEPEVKFECPWKYGACHFYPACSHEEFDANHYEDHGTGHEREHHDECWMQGWFDNGGHSYDGEDSDTYGGDYGIPAGMNRKGWITTTFEGDYVSWEFAA
jgi:hypothetical protein